MGLLETILTSTDFEEYIDIFKDNGIESHTLKILSDLDLQLLGIQDEEKRKQFLNIVRDLGIPSEKVISMRCDKSYIQLILNQISLHVQKQYANVIPIVKRNDIDICDIELTPAVITLQHVLRSMDNSLNTFEKKVLKKKRRNNGKFIIFSSLIISTATMFICCKYLLPK
ncbi:uncharacterized protein LOC126886465 [Diabrotica virgifera virgifera]|uniref:Uncharacterized protein LOC114339311 n=1 Tax=Diabrotica virgifera virgifera TaxID=50390 RepID=A0A6P7G965_DIAVI|nr:uncharacterized protein LOC126886465 [Diabrotica virgifera virgifera]